MIGVAINAAGIAIGAIVGLTRKPTMSAANEAFFKVAMGVATIVIGLSLTWRNINGSFGTALKQLFIVLVSMSLGKFLGRLMKLQHLSNRVGHFATSKLSKASAESNKGSDGMMVSAALALVSPLAFFAAVHEGLTGFSSAFVVKALMDGLAALSFVAIFGWSVALSAFPVLAGQGTMVLLVRMMQPWLQERGLVESILATDGLLIFSVALVILNLKKVELTDYLPSLAIAPIITALWR